MTEFRSRAAWGARPATSVSHNITPSRGGVTIHWEGLTMGTFDHSRCDGKVRGIQAFHMDGRGWNDVAYNAIVCPHGTVYVGRWIGVRSAAQGTNEGNQNWYAVCYLGGVGDPVPPAALQAFADTIAVLRAQGGAGPGVVPHSHWHSTQCPGDTLRAWIAAGLPTAPRPQPSAPTGVHTIQQPVPKAPPALDHGDDPAMKTEFYTFRTDGSGNGWKATNVPWSKFVACGPVSDRRPKQDGSYPRLPKVAPAQDAGKVVLVVTGGDPGQPEVIYFTHTK